MKNKSPIFSLGHKRHILIVCREGAGWSMAARCLTKICDNNEYFHFIYTEETKVSDLIAFIFFQLITIKSPK